MRFELTHTIAYEYSKPVFLEPHTFLLRPREDAVQRVVWHECVIDPVPSLQTASTDLSGNAAIWAWFRGEHRSLRVTARSEVEVGRSNPFDYLPDESSRRIPVVYRESLRGLLGPFLKVAAGIPEPVKAFSHDIAARTHHATIPFLMDLCRTLAFEFKREWRESGAPRTPEETLKLRQGSCRDLTVLFMACCRAQGLAARFVSGYYEQDAAQSEHDLHAWAEVYISGGGWRGFDPTAGLAETETHIPLAASAQPELATPVTGTFRGTGVTTRMSSEVQIRRILQPV